MPTAPAFIVRLDAPLAVCRVDLGRRPRSSPVPVRAGGPELVASDTVLSRSFSSGRTTSGRVVLVGGVVGSPGWPSPSCRCWSRSSTRRSLPVDGCGRCRRLRGGRGARRGAAGRGASVASATVVVVVGRSLRRIGRQVLEHRAEAQLGGLAHQLERPSWSFTPGSSTTIVCPGGRSRARPRRARRRGCG